MKTIPQTEVCVPETIWEEQLLAKRIAAFLGIGPDNLAHVHGGLFRANDIEGPLYYTVHKTGDSNEAQYIVIPESQIFDDPDNGD